MEEDQAEKRARIEQQIDEMAKKQESAPIPTQKSNKPVIITIIVVLFLVIFGLVGYIILDKTVWNNPNPSNNQSQSDNSDSSDEATVVEITDANFKSDLNEKSSILLNFYVPEGAAKDYGWVSTVASNMYSYLDELMSGNELTNTAKIYNVLRHLFYNKEAFSKVSPNDYTTAEATEVIKNSTLQGYPNSFFEYVTKIDAETVAKIYKELYGEDIKHQSANEICGGFYYDANKGIYLKGLYDACGGSTTVSFNFYREKYESAGDEAYIYLRVGTVNCEHVKTDCAYFKGYLNYDDLEKADPLGTVNAKSYYAEDTGIITADNYEQFAPYRMVFEKQDNGNYIFKKIEQL